MEEEGVVMWEGRVGLGVCSMEEEGWEGWEGVVVGE